MLKYVVQGVKYIKLTAVFLISPIVAVSFAITLPALWDTLVHGKSTVEL